MASGAKFRKNPATTTPIKNYLLVARKCISNFYICRLHSKNSQMKRTILAVCLLLAVSANAQNKNRKTMAPKQPVGTHKTVVYQVFTRLFGNQNTTNKPWGTIEENGVGKFNDFTDKALSEIKNLVSRTFGIPAFRTMRWFVITPNTVFLTMTLKWSKAARVRLMRSRIITM